MKRSRKIYIITEFYYPIVTSTGYYMTEIAEYLAVQGEDVHVICTGAKYNETVDYLVERESERNGVHIHRVLSGNIDKNNFFKRIIRLLWSSFRLFMKVLLKVRKGDRLLVVTNPAFLILLMPLIKKARQIEYFLLVHDIFPENLVAIGKVGNGSITYKVLKFCFDRAYSYSDICISIGRDMTEVIKSKISHPLKIEYISNWADDEAVYPMCKQETNVLKTLDITQKFIFQFAGNLGHAQGLDNILEAIKLVDNPDLHFLFIGGGAKSQTIADFVKINPLRNVTLLGFQDRSTQNDFLNACDVAIVTLSDGMFGLGVPSKSYNIMAAGKPIIVVADAKSEISLCVEEHGLGKIVEPNNPLALKHAFETIYQEKTLFPTIQKNARQLAETVFAKKTILEKYYQLLR